MCFGVKTWFQLVIWFVAVTFPVALSTWLHPNPSTFGRNGWFWWMVASITIQQMSAFFFFFLISYFFINIWKYSPSWVKSMSDDQPLNDTFSAIFHSSVNLNLGIPHISISTFYYGSDHQSFESNKYWNAAETLIQWTELVIITSHTRPSL